MSRKAANIISAQIIMKPDCVLGLATGSTPIGTYKQLVEWYKKGAATLERWLPRYDTGYWLRYDLNPKKQELLFRLNNKYGYQLEPLAIDTIGLTDLVSGV